MEPDTNQAPDQGGDAPKAWHESISWGAEGYQVPDKIKEFKTPADLANAYENARKKIGDKGILIPKEGEDRAGFEAELKKHLGLLPPEKPDDYGWTPPDDVKDAFGNLKEKFAELHKQGIDKKTAELLLNNEAEGIRAIQAAQVEIAKESEKLLKEEWGADYDDRIKAVGAMKEKYPDAVDALTSVGLANSAPILKMMDEVARSTMERRPAGTDAQLRESTQAQIDALKARPEYRNNKLPGHEEVKARLHELYKNVAKLS